MAWQTPKTDWTAVDGLRDSDLNRIEGNLAHLYNDKVREDTYVYVNATSGNDTTGNGTAAYPFKTIGKALGSVARDTNGKDVVISIAAGYYQEDVVIKGFTAPVVLTNGGETVTVGSFRVDGCHCSLSGNIEIRTNRVIYVVNGGTLTGAGAVYVDGAYISLNYGATLSLDKVTCDNSPGFAIVVDGNSRFYGAYIDGDANDSGLSAQGGSTIAFGDINMEITNTIYFTAMGGRILTGSSSNI